MEVEVNIPELVSTFFLSPPDIRVYYHKNTHFGIKYKGLALMKGEQTKKQADFSKGWTLQYIPFSFIGAALNQTWGAIFP
jgi:hypothetical protein